MVEHVVSAFAGRSADVEVADIAFDHPEVRRSDKRRSQHVVEIGAVAGREIVDADYLLPQAEQILEKVGTDKPRHARNHPHSGVGLEGFSNSSVRNTGHGLKVEGVPADATQGKRAREHVNPIKS